MTRPRARRLPRLRGRVVTLSHRAVGRLRRLLMVRGSHRWNAWVRALTARLG